MINKLVIKNIQSHKDSELIFSPGINCIIGSSNNGKSAILRALNWSIYNRPLGIDNLLSNWCYDKKGKQIKEMSVTIQKGDSVLIRKKSKDENCYIINDEKLEAIKTDVPEQTEKFFRLSDTNIQKQMDSPFLLSLGAGEVAKYFNKTVRLDVIDSVLSNAESTRRKTNSKLNEVEETISEYENKLGNFDWLETVEKLINKYERIQAKEEKLNDEIEKLENSLNCYLELENQQKKYESVIKNKKLVEKILKLNETTKEKEIEKLENQLEEFEQVTSRKVNQDFSESKKLIFKIEKLETELDEMREKRNKLGTSLSNCEYYLKLVEDNKVDIVVLKKQLPKICPLCGGILKNGECENENDCIS